MEKIENTDLSLWEAFYWVAKKESFSQAAKHLRIQVPMVSKKISRLEEQLNIRLFQRSTRKIALTREGFELLPQTEALLSEARALESRFLEKSESLSGLIRLTCVPAFARSCLSPSIVKFQALYPHVQFSIHLSDHIIDLIESEMDLAIRVEQPRGADFVYRKLIPNQLIFCASPQYLKEMGTPRKPEDLFLHRMLLLSAYDKCKIANTNLTLRDLKKASSIESQSGMLLTALCLDGAGIAARSNWDVRKDLKEGRLIRLLKGYPLDEMGHLYAVTPHKAYLPARVRAFIDFLTKESKFWSQ